MRRAYLLVLSAALLCSCGVFHPGAKPVGNSPGDELVETGYGTSRRDDITGSISKVKMNDAQSYTNMYDYLRGRVPGVTVNGKTIRIRSLDTPNGNAEAQPAVAAGNDDVLAGQVKSAFHGGDGFDHDYRSFLC